MSDYSRKRVSLSTLLASVKALLVDGYSEWVVKEYPNTNMSDLFMYLKSITHVPACILTYTTGTAPEDVPQRTLTFNVVVVTRYLTNTETAISQLQTLIEKAITLLDYQIANSYVQIRFQNDESIQLDRGSLLTASKLNFEARDYSV